MRLTLLTLLLCTNVLATTPPKFAVGNCQPNLQSFSSIQAAVATVPSGAIVLVCPGTYPEQIHIAQPITLQGVNIGGKGAAIISIPSDGLQQNTTLNQTNNVAAQVLVQNTTGPVNLTNLIIDGTGGSLSGGYVVGAFYQESSGTITRLVFRNQSPAPASGISTAIESLASSQSVSVVNSLMHDFSLEGIYLNSSTSSSLLSVSLKTNTIRGTGAETFGIGASSTAGTVQGNSISGVGTALYLFNSALTITSNNFSVLGGPLSQGGWVLDGGTNILKSNQLEAGSAVGVELFHSHTALPDANILQNNTFSDSSSAVVGCAPDVSGNSVTGNRIVDATIGVSVPSGNVAFPNTYFGVSSFVNPCP